MIEIVCCAFDAAALAVGLWLGWRVPFRGRARELAGAIAFALLAFLAITILVGGWGGFGALRGYCHATFCVLLPTAAVRALRIRRAAPGLAILYAVAFVVGEGCYLWARRVEPFRLEVTRATVTSPRLAGLARPLRVVAVADLQTDAITGHEVAVFDAIVAENPDLVLFLGDYLQADRAQFERQLPALQAQLRRLRAPLGMFAVDGDVDAWGAERVFAGTDVRIVSDSRCELPGVPIEVIGLSRARSRAPFVDVGLVRRTRGERFPIVIGHAPDFMLSVLRDGFDPDALMVAGHTHGGQVQVPGFGPVLTLSAVPRWLAAGGVFLRGRTWLCCSRGIGMERSAAPRIRFWCRPQLVVLELAGG